MLKTLREGNEKNASRQQNSEYLFVGIDLGTSQSAIATSSGRFLNVASIAGFPKDIVSHKLLRKPIVFGDECFSNRMSVNLYYPLEKGVINTEGDAEDTSRQKKVIEGFIKHLISLAGKPENQKIYVVVGAPSQAASEDKQAIISSLRGLVDAVLIVSEPFLVSYGMGMYGFGVIVDIGAGTLDICRMHGSIPETEDQRTLYKAGNHIDKMFYNLLKSRIPNARISPYTLRKIKEQHALVGKKPHKVLADFMISSKLVRYDIMNELSQACESILPDMFKVLRELILEFEPEFQPLLRENILLAGCGSRIRGIDTAITKKLSDLGKIKVGLVEDPIFSGAIGGLKLAQDMPLDEWDKLVITNSK